MIENINIDIKEEVKSRVEKGADFLDEHYPEWYKEVDDFYLSMGSCSQCVLGQIYGTYLMGLSVLPKMTTRLAMELGFELHKDYDGYIDTSEEYYDLLTEAWKEEIKQR